MSTENIETRIEYKAYLSIANSLRRQVIDYFDEYIESEISLPSIYNFIQYAIAAEEVENEEIAEMKRETELTLQRDRGNL